MFGNKQKPTDKGSGLKETLMDREKASPGVAAQGAPMGQPPAGGPSGPGGPFSNFLNRTPPGLANHAAPPALEHARRAISGGNLPMPTVPAQVPPQQQRWAMANKMIDGFRNNWTPNPILMRLFGGR